MHPAKRQRRSKSVVSDETGRAGSPSDYKSASEADASDAGTDASPDTEDEIADAKRQKSKKTLKRKHRATDPSNFGATLQSLLDTNVASDLPLSLKPSVARKRNEQKLEQKAKRVLQIEKKEKEDNRRIRDVIGGWGGESERALRKVAQRGVVKLFNAIQQSQAAAAVAEEEAKASRGTGKPSLPAPALDKISKTKGRKKDNVIGRAKSSNLEQEDFMDIIRSGGIVAK
ncbi:hypothetical protein PUNSTDRAFT_48975 [Punctularia strigosozonata HHB-11173 SS5]|uniref:uncharacterized protein n=1 Tax=Punctularia strigosozonata (strain HHB-11173) TaxID=741275 RepID=UPI0004416C98|nr:uncharacterized protein PUNSTDRAFT_48975 [Punctularia strigosozonata HHB-11173 SS5]EIN14145.1 hypothetical protein PUNSTDRAFT_48975 [Punctularia strigosozonata HHB-11173 SS5]